MAPRRSRGLEGQGGAGGGGLLIRELGSLLPRGHSRVPLCPQVSHHPPVSAFHISNRKDGFCISGSITAKSRFYGEWGAGLPWDLPGPGGDGGRTGSPDAVARFLSLPTSPGQGPGARQSPRAPHP